MQWLWYGISQVAAVIYLAIGSAIVIAAFTVKLSRWVNGHDQPAQSQALGVFAKDQGVSLEAKHEEWIALLSGL